MTHDELMQATKSPTYMNSRTLEHPYLVIRAVLELHKPVNGYGLKDICLECYTVGHLSGQAIDVLYPCATIEAIKAELNA
jgi:hypothetical protein